MKLFDSHCHLDDPAFDKDRDAVIQKALDAEVNAMMIVGVTEKVSKKTVTVAESHNCLYASVGIHPHDAKDCNESALNSLQILSQNPNVLAWGETGLDFNRMYSPRKDQEKWFIRQIEIADELNLPMIFHERDSGGRFLEILKHYHNKDRKGVVHCFNGTQKELMQYLELGYFIGITGILTIKSRGKNLRRLVSSIPDDRLLVETDAPYLTPAPEKNKTRRNEPAFVRSTLIKLAHVIGKDPGVLSKKIWENTCQLYGIEIL